MMQRLSIVLFSLALLLCAGCQADKASSTAGQAGEAVRPAAARRHAGPRPLLTVLPVSFSAESRRNYPDWIESMQKAGYGNAIWQELEDILYDSGRFELAMEPPGTTDEAFRQLLAARVGAGVQEIQVDLPERVLTINVNFFVAESESMSMMTVKKEQRFHATVYLRYYDLDHGAINRAVPATGDAVAPDLLDATRQAARRAAEKLLMRLDRQP